MNLSVNARDAMPNGGALPLETEAVVLDPDLAAKRPDARPGLHGRLTVTDTGHGMDRATMEHIFEPFFTTKAPGQGMGLGLATVYRIVRQSGGHITVDSGPGLGTTFGVYLPADVAAAALAPGAPASTGDETILLCEDSQPDRKLAAQILRGAGYAVILAADEAPAVDVAARHPGRIALLVTDVILPDTNGRAVSESVRLARPDVRTLFISGYTADVIAPHGVLDEGVELLEKPFTRERLLQRVRRLIDEDAGR